VVAHVVVRVVEDRGAQPEHTPFHLRAIVWIRPAPARGRAPDEPDDRAWIPTAAVPPATEIGDESRDGEAVHLAGHGGQRTPDLGRELVAHALVGVEVEHPFAGRRVERELLLDPIARPRIVHDARGVLPGDLRGGVARAAVDHDDLVAPGDAVEVQSYLARFVLADDDARDGRPAGNRRRSPPAVL